MSSVLVVEDEPDIREMVALLLTSEGYDVHQVGTGEDALPRIGAVDAVLLDIRLPGISGLQVVERLSAADRRRVLFMSAHQDMEQRDIAAEFGCAGFLAKPFDFEDLFRRLRLVVGASPA